MKIKTWQERLGTYHHNTDMHRAFMQAEIDELREALGRFERENEQRNKLATIFANRKTTPATEDADFYPACPFDSAPHPPMSDCDCVDCAEYWLGRDNEIPGGIVYGNK